MSYRIERDTMGEIQVPNNTMWGAQTQRSLENFPIGKEKMPYQIIYALALLKQSSAIVNHRLGKLDESKKNAIVTACEEIIAGKWNTEFPLVVWQTGSGTQSNMNLNEVIAHRAIQILGKDFTKEKVIHPNDHVNMSQSSNDIFPAAMHISAVLEINQSLIPPLQKLRGILEQKSNEFRDIIKVGRTHLQDATPLTLGQEFSGYVTMLEKNIHHIQDSLHYLYELAIGGTAVGTGLNAPKQFGEMVAQVVAEYTKINFISAGNKFHALTSHDAIVFVSGALKSLAGNLMKIANDIRWLASGPRCGIGELNIPENEPGSSIMPGKVNPTQCEAITMIACQVFGNDVTIAMGASQGNFELNVFKPVIIYNLLQSIRLLGDGMDSFAERCVKGITVVREKINKNLEQCLMLVTALNPHIGYEKSAKVAKTAYLENITLKEAVVKLGFLSPEDFDRYIIPQNMV